MARRTTSKTGKSRSATSSGESGDTSASDPSQDATSDKAAPDPTPAEDATPVETPLPDDASASPEGGNDDKTLPLSDGPAQMGEDTAQAPDDTAQDLAASQAADPVVADDPIADSASVTDHVDPTEDDKAPNDAVAAETPPIAPPAAPSAPPARGGFVPLVLGGALAAALGYGAHYLQTSNQTAPDVANEMQAELAQLRAELADRPDMAAVEAQLAAMSSDAPGVAEEIGNLDAAVNDLRTQIAAMPDVAALQAQIDDLRAAPEAEVDFGPLQGEIARLDASIAALQADMDDLRTLSTERVAQAEAAVNTALATAALDRIAAALVTGAPFADALDEIRQAGATPPPALDAAASGVQTVEALQDSFDAAARAAVAASLQAAPADSTTERLGNFLRAQVGARSLAPRDGDDADAITSRAGVAIADGDLAAAREELNALPEAGRRAMAEWLDALETRLNAQAAIAELSAQVASE